MTNKQTLPEAPTPPAPTLPAGAKSSQRVAGAMQGASRHWRTLLAAGLVVLALLFAWQALLQREARTATVAVQRAVDNAVPYVERTIQAAVDQVATAVTDPVFEGLLGDDASARSRAAKQLGKQLPDALAVVVYSTTPDALLDSDADAIGYLQAAELARAQASGERQVGAIAAPGGAPRISIVQPVTRDGEIMAYAAVNLPFRAIVRTLHSDVRPAQGRIDVRLGPDAASILLASSGDAERGEVDVAMRVPATDLWVTGTRAASRSWLPGNMSPLPLWVLVVLALGGAMVLVWGARLQVLWRALEDRRAAGVGSDPTFAQVLKGPEKGSAAAAVAEADQGDADADFAAERAATVAVDPTIFRAYDIRGVVGKTLTSEVARALGQAIGSEARDRGQREIVVGRDGRNSGPMLASALIEGLRSTGIDVIDIGQAPTPLVYFACYHLNTGSGVAVTGSHNPPDYNGFKIVLGGETLAMDAIQALAARIGERRFHTGGGQLRSVAVADDYVDRIADDVQAQRPLKVIVDCGNGVTGEVGPRVLEEIGCEVIALFDEIDGDFPNHHPDPSNPANLADLMLAVEHHDADLGIAFDGDGDRLGVVTREGEIIFPDRQLMLFAMDVLVRDPGATIIYDVKCTGHLQPLILRHGGSPLMWKTGHSLIKSKMRETGAALAGEMSGHFFFRERWYGFDDGIYAAARLVEILTGDAEQRTPEAIFATLPKGVSTPELKVETEEGQNHAFIDAFCRKAEFPEARLTTIDGLRADWPDGWGLVRASNTTPSLVLRFDADSVEALERIQELFRTQLLAVNPELDLPF